MKEGKIWGSTQIFSQTATTSTHHISVKKGGYCSKHKHEHKYNLFYVVDGELEITIWRDGDMKDITILRAGQVTGVSPGFYHQFKALKETEAIEVYQVILTDPDIQRENVGGIEK